MDFLLGFLPKGPDSAADSAASTASPAPEAAPKDDAPAEEAAPGAELDGRWGDMKVGDTVDGKVSFRNNVGVFVKLENGKTVRALVPRDDAFKQLKPKQELKGMTVESLSSGGGFVSVPGLPKLRLTEDLKVGDTVDGYVARITAAGVFVNVGLDRNAKVLSRRTDAFHQLKKKQELKGMTVESVSEKGVLVSVPGLTKLKLMRDFRVGDTVDGTVALRNWNGLYVDIGCESLAKVLAPRHAAFKLEPSQELKGLTIESVSAKGILVSVPGLQKLKLIEDFEVGDAVEGRVAGVGYLDVGAENRAKINGPFGEVRKLSKSDELPGVTVEAVDMERRMLRLKVPGLSELVAGREAPKKRRPSKRRKKQPPAPKQNPQKQKERPEARTQKQTSAETQQALDMRTIVVDGDNLQGKKIKIQLKGGLAFDSSSKSGKTVKLVRK